MSCCCPLTATITQLLAAAQTLILGVLHLQSADHAEKCASCGFRDACVPCGRKFPNILHLEDHLSHPKHAAQAAWLAGKAAAAVQAAANAAATARAAAQKPAGGQQQAREQPAAKQQPAAEQQQQPQLPAAAQPQQQSVTQQELNQPQQQQPAAEGAPAAGPKVAALEKRPLSAGLVRGCGICGMEGDVPAAHFSVCFRCFGKLTSLHVPSECPFAKRIVPAVAVQTVCMCSTASECGAAPLDP